MSRDLYRQQALSQVGDKVNVIRGGDLSTSLTMTLLTDLSPSAPRHLFVQLREASNTQWDFILVVTAAIDAGHLVPGDTLIADNASVHKGEDSFDVLLELLDAYNISLMFLPKYSPEFNPCELVFGLLKNHLRCYRKTDDFYFELMKVLAAISVDQLWSFYFHCFK